MKMKDGYLKGLLMSTALLEGSTGLALIAAPAFIIELLFASILTEPPAIILARVAGASLLSLAIACWFLRKSEKINGFLFALLFYNLASVLILSYAGLYQSLSGLLLWPAVVAHIAVSAWIAKLLYRNKG